MMARHTFFWRHRTVRLSIVVVMAASLGLGVATSEAQESTRPDENSAGPLPVESVPETGQEISESDQSDDSAGRQPNALSLLWLISKGGWMMVPIGFLSIFVVALVFERSFGLRRAKVMPKELVLRLRDASANSAGFDPRYAYRVCQQFPSTASAVIRAMLLKVGRPHSEVENAVSDACQREADRLYANVRWLNLAAAVAPLIGLFGTVWGMIKAFYDTTQLEMGQNKADFLASGIYVALATTLGGLAVAIPAAIFAHYFEGRIQTIIHRIEELLFHLLAQIERYEGKLRVNHDTLGSTNSKREPGSTKKTNPGGERSATGMPPEVSAESSST